jgi:multicomponent Na+:H+ antiporter subunit D
MAAFTVCALSLIGIPGTVGFISKWYLVLAALETGTTRGIIAAIGVISASLVAIIYVWRLVEVAYFTNPSNVDTSVTEASWPTLLSLWILAGSCLVFGLATDLTVGVSRLAARMLLGIS